MLQQPKFNPLKSLTNWGGTLAILGTWLQQSEPFAIQTVLTLGGALLGLWGARNAWAKIGR